MGKTFFAALCIGLPALIISCSNDSGGSGGGSGGSSVTSTGGAQGGSGGSATGGRSATGGSASGGSSTSSSGGSGGSSATGGKTSTGGATSTGGTSASGGTTSSGGAGAGGTTSTGGKGGTATGGTTSAGTGGTTSAGTGGTTRPGGTTGSGGAGGAGGTGGTGGSTGAGGSTAPTDGYPLGNPAVPSAGCGKALPTSVKTGANTSYKINSAGINNREYIMYIPSNYDSNKPYRLVFGMHCMGSSATQCANGDGFYRLKPLDTGNTTIFVAPQGYTDSMPWRTGKTDDKDHVFFDDMLKKFKSEMCIDESRVFSVGFSFGAMFTNALAQTHQSVLRAVTVYATADYNIYFPANTGKPLAYMGVHGKADDMCPFSAGQSSIKRFVTNNKCTGTPTEATSSTHVVYDYTCPSNYPVKWATHTGGHTDVPTDPGQSKAWTIDLTWKWITQF